MKQVASLLASAFEDPKLVNAAVHLVKRLCEDNDVLESLTELSAHVVQQPVMVEVFIAEDSY